MAPELWDAVRYLVDESDEDGLYILTGSTIVDESKIMHSGAGRIKRIVMRPMSLYESGESTGAISLMDLFNDEDLNIDGITSNLSISDLIFAACRGGWPESLNKKTKKQQLAIVANYIDIICNSDVSKIDGVRRNPQKVKAILKSYSRNISTLATKKTLMKDIKTEYGVYQHLHIIRILMLLKDYMLFKIFMDGHQISDRQILSENLLKRNS